ncbi:hypothetical protein BGZ82_011553 [Podila clonocystis]|nr:hypothetical protein BGZ82_011553 [Podila clonocystis]
MSDTPASQDVFSKNQRKYRQQLRKRAIISLEQKKAICRYYVTHSKARHVEINDALGIDVERTTILKIVKEKDKWLDLDSRGSAGKKAVRRVARFSKVNRAVALWLQICHPAYLRQLFIWGPGNLVYSTGLDSFTADEECEGEQLNMGLPSAKEIQTQARSFAAMFSDETAFKASSGWLSSFRQNLSLAQFPAIASTLELMCETEPPFYRYIGRETDARSKPDSIKLSRFIYDHIILSEGEEQDFALDPDILHTLSRNNNIHPPDDASQHSPIQDPGLDLSTSALPLVLRNEFGTNLVGMSNAMYLSNSPTSHDLQFSSGPSFEMQNFETQSERPKASRLSTINSHLDTPIQGPAGSYGLPSTSSSSKPGSPVAIGIGGLGLPLQERLQSVSRMAIQSPSSSFDPPQAAQHQQVQVPSREQVYSAMTMLMAWMSHDPDAVSVVGSDNTFYLTLSQARMRLLQQQQQEQQRH